MKKYLVKTPSLIKFLFWNRTWNFSKKRKHIYLTFDDGPTPEITSWVLELLQKYQAKATFFCIGKNIAYHPKIFQQIVDNGHSIGNHSHYHLKETKVELNEYLNSIVNCEKSILKHTSKLNQKSKLFRPPYGKMTLSQSRKIRNLGFKIIMWDVLSADFDTSINANKCLNNVVKNIENGSIVVFHDSLKASEKLKFVLPKILDYYTVKGYKFKRIAELN